MVYYNGGYLQIQDGSTGGQILNNARTTTPILSWTDAGVITANGLPGAQLQIKQYAPTTADSATPIVSSTGLTSINFTTGGDQGVTFTGPPTGFVKFKIKGFFKGGAAAATSFILGIVSTTHATSPGTVVGVTGLAELTPTATAADNGTHFSYEQRVAATAGTAFTWYPAAMYSGTAPSIIAQGPTGQTTVPTGAPFVVEVITSV